MGNEKLTFDECFSTALGPGAVYAPNGENGLLFAVSENVSSEQALRQIEAQAQAIAALRDAWEVRERAEAELAALDQADLDSAAWEQRVREEAKAAGQEPLICHVGTSYDAGYREAVERILGREE